MKKRLTLLLSIILMVLSWACVKTEVKAAAPTDFIILYDITVDPNEDASLTMTYDIEWEVLESDGVGPLEWVKIGIPNKNASGFTALSDNIRNVSFYKEGSETFARVDLDRKYYKGEKVRFKFQFVQNNVYLVNKPQEGYATYSFTPGWFNDIKVKDLYIHWNADKIDSWDPNAEMENGYIKVAETFSLIYFPIVPIKSVTDCSTVSIA